MTVRVLVCFVMIMSLESISLFIRIINLHHSLTGSIAFIFMIMNKVIILVIIIIVPAKK